MCRGKYVTSGILNIFKIAHCLVELALENVFKIYSLNKGTVASCIVALSG